MAYDPVTGGHKATRDGLTWRRHLELIAEEFQTVLVIDYYFATRHQYVKMKYNRTRDDWKMYGEPATLKVEEKCLVKLSWSKELFEEIME